MITRIKKILTIIATSSLLIIVLTIPLHAATKKSEKSGSEVWVSADSGLSSIDYYIKYEENYSTSGSNNIFGNRTRTYRYTTAFAVNEPYMQLGNILHQDSGGGTVATFSSFTEESAIFDKEYDFNKFERNSTSKTYAKTTGNTGRWVVLLVCRNMSVPTRTDSCSIALKTS